MSLAEGPVTGRSPGKKALRGLIILAIAVALVATMLFASGC
jgi:hypothetical protein